jgi:GTP pyrophosphokinase
MCHLANCCKPLPGDVIQGFITQGRGVSVHRDDCDQFANLMRQHPERQIDVAWISEINARFSAQIEVVCMDRDGILRDITTILVNENISLLGVNSDSDTAKQMARIKLRVELSDKALLSRIIDRLRMVKGVEHVRRFDH